MKTEAIAFLGDRDSVSGFRPLGVSVHAVRSQEDARKALDAARERGSRVVLVTEEVALWLQSELREVAAEPLPVVLVVPSTRGTQGLGMRQLRRLVEKAVGADIFSREDQEKQT